MKKKELSAKGNRLRPRIRIYHDDAIALGPGKINLLLLVAETGSLSEAARRMKLSYMKAWLLMQVMNTSFRCPLLKAGRGGSGGGAELTPTGRRVLALYQKMREAAVAAMEPDWKILRGLLQKGSRAE